MQGKPYVERELGDKTLRFRKLTPYCRLEVIRRTRAPDRERFKTEMKEQGVAADDLIATLQAHDEETAALNMFLRIFDSAKGKQDIFDLAASTMKLPTRGEPEWERRPDAAELAECVSAMTEDEQASLASELTGTPLTRLAPSSDAAAGVGGDDPNDTYDDPNASGGAGGARALPTAGPEATAAATTTKPS